MKPRNASRLAASIGTVSIALMLGGLVLMFIDRHARLPAGTSGTWALSNVLEDAVNIPVSIIGIVLASRRPGNRLGWLFLTAGAGLGLQKFTTAYGLHSLVADPGSLPAGRAMAWVSNWIWAIPITMLCFLFLLFPTGQLPSRRWRPVGWLVVGAFTLAASDAIVAATQSWKHPFNPSSTGSGGVLGFVLLVPIIGAIVLSLAGVVVRFRRSVGEERLQLKWFVTGAVLVVVTLVMSIFWVNTPPLLSVLQSLAFVLLWAAIAIAVLKYRLYEIDVVISKAALYGTLAVFITIVYVGLVVGVGSLVGNRRSPLLSALAAAVIAVAFQPVRHRAGRLANRMVYGKRATPYEVLSDA